MTHALVTSGNQRVLHVGGSVANARRIRQALRQSTGDRYVVDWVGDASSALRLLAGNRICAVLLDTQSTDGSWMDELQALVRAAPDIPILAVGADECEETTRPVILAGASEYLLTSRLDSYWLPRMLRHAIDRKQSETASLAERQRTQLALNTFGDAFVSIDLSGRVNDLNATAEAMTGWARGDATGRPLDEVVQILDRVTRESASVSIDRAGRLHRAPHRITRGILIRRDGSESTIEHAVTSTYDRRHDVTGAVLVFRDISAAHAASLKMSHLATHDPLTNLPNRMLLSDRLARAIALAQRHGRQLAVLFLDIDRFKYINDSLGHQLGDELLHGVSRIITTCVRSSDTVSRYGGDEFVIVLSELDHAEDAALGARKIITALEPVHKLAGHELRVTVSIGISVYPGDGQDAESLLQSADMALYDAKNNGRDGYRFFKPDLNGRAVERQSIEAGLHEALDKHEFELFYQPKINLQTGSVVGAEALLRWHHPVRGLVEPAVFIPVAEDCGLIRPIGRWVVREACRQARAWQDRGLRRVPVAVNVSAVEFSHSGFLKGIVDILTETRLDPHYLEIEITESALMRNVESTSSLLHALKSLGVQLAIDDFGTGWSSLSYLSEFPIDALKVDKSFVQAITPGSDAASIVSAVINLGRSLKQRVIAEGVETHDQLTFLRAEDCDEGQGYYFNRPLIAARFADVLEASGARVPAH